jgi:hypothetical protein
MTQSIIKGIVGIYDKVEFTPSIIVPKQEWSTLFYHLTGQHIIWSYGFRKALEGAYDIDRDALRKTLITLLKISISYFNDQISKYPDLQDEYKKKISNDKTLIAKLERLW